MSKVLGETQLRAIGNSTGIILPNDVLTKLALEKGDKLFIIENTNGNLELSPFDQELHDSLESAKDIIKRYRNTFKELAK